MIIPFLTPAVLFLTAPNLRSFHHTDMASQLSVDRNVRVSVHTSGMEWAPSPSPSVWRKRVALEGPQESGRVTSVVRYDANSQFNEHGHPDGEEILVLEGSWQDANGDHPAGTYMLNPEGFRHAPCSRDGCVLWVKLRQHGGPSRKHTRLDTNSMQWEDTDIPGVKVKELYSHPDHVESMQIEKWDAGAKVERECQKMTEFLVVEGEAEAHDASETFTKWSWLRLPAGATLSMTSAAGCQVFVKEGEWLPPSSSNTDAP
ncbi:unnamed protein product [Ectocarpus sp. 12 AP-2014]